MILTLSGVLTCSRGSDVILPLAFPRRWALEPVPISYAHRHLRTYLFGVDGLVLVQLIILLAVGHLGPANRVIGSRGGRVAQRRGRRHHLRHAATTRGVEVISMDS